MVNSKISVFSKFNSFFFLVNLFLIFTLIGCGGGGGDSNDDNDNVAPAKQQYTVKCFNDKLDLLSEIEVVEGTKIDPSAAGFCDAGDWYLAKGVGGKITDHTVDSDTNFYKSDDIAEVGDPAGLSDINNNLSGKYVLAKDISLKSGDGVDSSKGWAPIGTFTGIFNGNGHKIADLWINRTSSYVGLFGNVSSNAVIKNLSVEIDSANGINAGSEVGGIAGYVYENGLIVNCAVTGGNIIGVSEVGGIAGWIEDNANITNSYSTVNISGTQHYIGGIVGYAEDKSSAISKTYATGAIVSGKGNYIGGIVGSMEGAANNNAAINPSITGSGPYYRNRVAGEADSKTSNNYALDTMSINPLAYGSDAGTDATIADFQDETFYADKLKWAFGGNDTAPWKMDTAKSPYPILYWQ
jgi:hypothetical protein